MNRYIRAGKSIALLTVALSVALTQSRSAMFAQESARAENCSGNGSSLLAARQFTVGLSPRAVIVADFNRDGRPDLAVADSGALNQDNVTILLGNGQGAFAVSANIRLSSFALNFTFRGLAAGDFNNDGNPDLVAAGVPTTASSSGSDGVAVIPGRGDGSFGAPVMYPTGNGATAVAVADFNGDTKPDLAVANQSAGQVSILTGNSDGSFGQATNVNVINGPVAVTAADLNHDGKADLAVAGVGGVALLNGNGAGGFATPVNVTRLTNSQSVVARDFNGDGKTDLVVGLDTALAVLINGGAGSFGEPNLIFTTGAVSIVTGDFNADGKTDLALTSARNANSIMSVMYGNGAGGFSQRVSFGTGRTPVGLVAGDFNQDNRADLAVANQQSNSVSILIGSNRIFNSALLAATTSFQRSLSAGDFNKDGRPDLVTSTTSGVIVSFSDAQTGGYITAGSYGSAFKISDTAEAAVAGDFNKDGNPDLMVVSGDRFGSSNSVVTLLPGSGTNIFDQAKTKSFTTGLRGADIVAADFNRDGNLDVATANAGSNDVSLLQGDGRGGFTAAVSLPVGLEPRSLAVSDFNGDGNPDLITANRNSVALSALLNNGQGGFTASLIGIGANPGVVVTGDFNGDGKADITASHFNSSQVTILTGNGNGTFNSSVLEVGKRPRNLAVGDFNGDGKTDLALTRTLSAFLFGSPIEVADDSVLLLAGNGAGRFSTAGELFVPAGNLMTPGDFDADGMPDLAVATDGNPNSIPGVWILRSACNVPMTGAVASVSAASYRDVAAASESIVAAFGTALSAQTVVATTVPLPVQLDGTEVKIKDSKNQERAAPLFFVSPNQINYQLPPGTAAGVAGVTITNRNGVSSTGTLIVTAVTPGLFTANSDGQGVPAALVLRVTPEGKQSYESVAQFDATLNRFVPRPLPLRSPSGNPFPPNDQLFLVLFGTGIRGVSSLANVTAKADGQTAEVLFAGPQGGFVGLDQVNVRLPIISSREADVEIFVDGIKANTVRISFGQ